ncbi:MAG: LPS assembly lipoprotein LptE, partial [Candidatus Zixiibacteriota bacterium]
LLYLVIGSALTFCVSCGVYSFSGSALSGVRTVGVPLFENQTTEYDLQEKLTEKVTNSFVADNTLKVVSARRADAVLYGVVTRYERKSHTFDGAGNTMEYITYVYVALRFEKRTERETIWEDDNMEGWGIYDAIEETEEEGKERALDKLAEDIVDRTVKGW